MTRRIVIVEVTPYEGERGSIRTQTEELGEGGVIYCAGELRPDGMVRFVDWGYPTYEDAFKAWPEAHPVGWEAEVGLLTAEELAEQIGARKADLRRLPATSVSKRVAVAGRLAALVQEQEGRAGVAGHLAALGLPGRAP